MSTVSKGNYYVRRTIDWLESLGYVATRVEKQYRVIDKKRKGPDGNPLVIFVKRDLWGFDVVAFNDEHMVWVQVKANAAHVPDGLRSVAWTVWPPGVKRWVVWWPPRRRLVEGPMIHEVEGMADERGGRARGLRALPKAPPEGVPAS